MSLSRKEACSVNPIIDDEDPNGTLHHAELALKFFQNLFAEGAPDGLSNNEGLGVYYLLGSVFAAIQYEREGAERNEGGVS